MSKFNELIKGTTPVIVNFYAEWALTSSDVAEKLKDIKQSISEDIKLIKIDFDKNESVAQKLSVIGVPSVLLFKEGKVIWRCTGDFEEEKLLEVIKENV